MTRLHVFIKVASDDAFELKAQALNDDPRLKAAGIAALKFATDKLFVAGGEFLTELPPPEITVETPSNQTPEVPVHGPRLRVFLRIINKEDAYDLKAKYLNGDLLLQEAGISDIKLVSKQVFVPMPVQAEKTPAKKEKPKSRGVLKWIAIVAVVGAIIAAGGLYLVGALAPTPATPAPVVQQPPAKVVAAPPTATAYVPPPATNTSAPVVVQDPPTLAPTDTPIPVVAQPDCSNDFSSDLNYWPIFFIDPYTYIITTDPHSSDFFGLDNGWYLFDIHKWETWAYSMCDAAIYDNVRIDARVENVGGVTSDSKLICRYSEENGWYEFNILSSGLYSIYFVNPKAKFEYTIKDGGSNDIKGGQAVNEFTAICQDNNLTLLVNGNEVITTQDDLASLQSGQVGVGISAYDLVPVTARFDWVVVTPQ